VNIRNWGMRLSFFLAIISTASGLGNFWRFPYIVNENGGGGFVWLYIFLVLVVGIPLLIGELLVGRHTGKSILTSISLLKSNKLNKAIANLSLLICLFVLGYFSVISSWVLFYFVQFLMSLNQSVDTTTVLLSQKLIHNGWLQFLLTAFHISLLITVVGKEIEEGLEKLLGYLLPLFGVLSCVLVWKSLSLDSSSEALRFLFYPNFSKLNWFSLSNALGQVLFTLSIGFTTMVTFGSVLPKDANLPNQSYGIALVDTLMSLFAGLLVFPLLFSMPYETSGPLLLFNAVPDFFNVQDNGKVYGALFFLFLYLGAFAASLSLFETIVVNFKEHYRIERTSGGMLVGGLTFLMAIPPIVSISYNEILNLKNKNLLIILDNILVNWLLPIVSLLLSQWIYYSISEQQLKKVFDDPDAPQNEISYKIWSLMLKWIVPIVFMLAFVLSFIGIFRS
jgi:NSS family neurotransmitter:Na+ symporter